MHERQIALHWILVHPGKDVEKDQWIIFTWKIGFNLIEIGRGQTGA